jgi:hypothetical protein
MGGNLSSMESVGLEEEVTELKGKYECFSMLETP